MASWYNNRRYNGNQETAGNPFSTYCSTFNPYNSLAELHSDKEPIVNLKDVLNDNSNIKDPNLTITNDFNPYNSNIHQNNIQNKNNFKTPIIQNSYNIINNNPYNKMGKISNNVTYNFYKSNNKKTDYITDLLYYSNKVLPSRMKNNNYYFNESPKNKKVKATLKNIKIVENPIKKESEEEKNIRKFERQETPKTYYSNEIVSDSESKEYTKYSNIVIQYSYKENPNVRFREYMEDKGKVVDNFNGNINSILFCLFDGHGGKEVSTYLQDNFPLLFKKIFPTNNIESNLIDLFPYIDDKLKQNNFYQVGSTACIIYITKEENKKYLYCANLGDTRCIILRNNSYERLSYDDRATDPNEYNRIINDGGIVFFGRVYGQLMLSRAFGDWELKSYGVISVPHIKRIEINSNDKFIVCASDGVWDSLSDQDVFNMSLKFEDTFFFCNEIIKCALQKGSMDNLSCFVIKLNN